MDWTHSAARSGWIGAVYGREILNMVSMRSNSGTAKTDTVWDANSISDFEIGGEDVLVVSRPPLENLGRAVEAGRIHEFLAPVTRQRVGFEVRSGLRELRLKSTELENDLICLVNLFLDQFNIEEARLRIEITRSQPCPNFHYDNVNVRVVTTYVGPTTEYQYVGESEIHVAPLYGLVFLKGLRHPTYRDTVHHRSPEIRAEQRRLCVAIDY